MPVVSMVANEPGVIRLARDSLSTDELASGTRNRDSVRPAPKHGGTVGTGIFNSRPSSSDAETHLESSKLRERRVMAARDNSGSVDEVMWAVPGVTGISNETAAAAVPFAVNELLQGLGAQLDQLVEQVAGLDSLTSQLVAEELAVFLRRCESLHVEVVGKAGNQGPWPVTSRYRSAPAWLSATHLCTGAAARGMLADDQWLQENSLFAEAFARGRLSSTHVSVVRRCVTGKPWRQQAFAEFEQSFVDAAQRVNPQLLARLIRGWAERVDDLVLGDDARTESEALAVQHESRSARWCQVGDMWQFEATLPAIDGALLAGTLNQIMEEDRRRNCTCRRAACICSTDGRTMGQRRADAVAAVTQLLRTTPRSATAASADCEPGVLPDSSQHIAGVADDPDLNTDGPDQLAAVNTDGRSAVPPGIKQLAGEHPNENRDQPIELNGQRATSSDRTAHTVGSEVGADGVLGTDPPPAGGVGIDGNHQHVETGNLKPPVDGKFLTLQTEDGQFSSERAGFGLCSGDSDQDLPASAGSITRRDQLPAPSLTNLDRTKVLLLVRLEDLINPQPNSPAAVTNPVSRDCRNNSGVAGADSDCCQTARRDQDQSVVGVRVPLSDGTWAVSAAEPDHSPAIQVDTGCDGLVCAGTGHSDCGCNQVSLGGTADAASHGKDNGFCLSGGGGGDADRHSVDGEGGGRPLPRASGGTPNPAGPSFARLHQDWDFTGLHHNEIAVRLRSLTSQWLTGNGAGSGFLPRAVALAELCDTVVQRVITGPDSQPLDIGRKTRIVPPDIRAALVARDRGCIIGDCDIPASWCHAHHIQHWAQGGSTALSNLALLCDHHHAQLHAGRWQVIMDARGMPQAQRHIR